MAEMRERRDAWIRLWLEDPYATPFTHPDWLLSFAEYMPCSPFIALGEEDGELACVWSLDRRGSTAAFLSDPMADYSRPLVSAAWKAEKAALVLFEAALSEGIRTLALREFLHGDPLPEALAKEAAAFGFRGGVRKGIECPHMSRDLDPGVFRDRFIESHTQKRVLKPLKKLGHVEFERLHGREAILAQLPDFFIQHTVRWAGYGETLFTDPSMRAFFTKLVRSMDEDMIFFSRLKVDGRIIAMDLDFMAKNIFYYYKPVFDIHFWKYSPGLAHLCLVGKEIADEPFRIFDFTRGTESYKLKFANETVANRNVLLSTRAPVRISFWMREKARSLLPADRLHKTKLKNALKAARKGFQKYRFLGLIGLLLRAVGKFGNKKLLYSMETLPELEIRGGMILKKGNADILFDAVELLDPVNREGVIASFAERLRSGDGLYGVYSERGLDFFSWVVRGRPARLGRKREAMELQAGTAFIEETHVSHEMTACRKRSVYLKMLVRRLLAEESLSCVLAACRAPEREKRRALEEAGFILQEKRG